MLSHLSSGFSTPHSSSIHIIGPSGGQTKTDLEAHPLTDIQSQFSPRTAVLLRAVTGNTESANTEPVLLGQTDTQSGSCQPLVAVFSSADQYVLSVLCVFLHKHLISYVLIH